jgi:hypothetical protein
MKNPKLADKRYLLVLPLIVFMEVLVTMYQLVRKVLS